MRKIGRSLVAWSVLLALPLLVTGCTMIHMSYPEAQSHFDFPNSNVTPIGHAVGSATTAGMVPAIQDADLEEQAINKAIAAKGGDLLVDYHITTDVKLIPLMFINFYTTTVTVEGTVAKMEIGKQTLR